MAAVAIPKYIDIFGKEKEKSSRGALGSLRTGITIHYANKAVTTGTAEWPTLEELARYGCVMQRGIPKNPYQDMASDSIVVGEVKGVIVGGRGGWCYDESTGEIWMNTNTVGENTW